MERQSLIFITGLFAVFMFCATVCLGFYLYRNVFNSEGKGAERKTGRTLKRFALIRRLHVLECLELGQRDKRLVIGHLLIGSFGILLVDTMGARGEYYGQPDESNWALLCNGKRIIIENPLRRQQEAMQVIREQLAANNIYKVHMEHILHFTSASKKNQIYVNDERLIRHSKLGKYLAHTRFEQDNGIDPDRIAEILNPFARG